MRDDGMSTSKKWRVVTRAEVRRTYEVLAENEKEALSESTLVMPEYEEEVEEETLVVEPVEE